MKILIIGNIGSGKTTIATRLKKKLSSLYISIDNLRKKYGDGSFEKEYLAWSQFLKYCEHTSEMATNSRQKTIILEFTGAGCHKHSVKQALIKSKETTLVILIKTTIDTCISRLSMKNFDIPYPWNYIPSPTLLYQLNNELNQDENSGFWQAENIKTISLNSDSLEPEKIVNKIISILNYNYKK